MEPVIMLVVAVLLILGIAYGAYWLVGASKIPHPFNMGLNILILLVALYALYLQLTGNGWINF